MGVDPSQVPARIVNSQTPLIESALTSDLKCNYNKSAIVQESIVLTTPGGGRTGANTPGFCGGARRGGSPLIGPRGASDPLPPPRTGFRGFGTELD